MNDGQVLSEIKTSLERSRRREERRVMRKVHGVRSQRAVSDLLTARDRCDAVRRKGIMTEDELVELVVLGVRALESTIDALGDKIQTLRGSLSKARAELRDQGGRLRAMDSFELKHAAKMGLVAESAAEAEIKRRPGLGPSWLGEKQIMRVLTR